MSLIIGLLSFVLVLICLFLCLLVLIQLPKKEAGMGQAFGGAATDALFGAGAGNALTKMTKYCAGGFLVLSLVLSVLNAQASKGRSDLIRAEINKAAAAPTAMKTAVPAGASNTVNAAATNAVAPGK